MAKRIKITANGKLLRRKASRGHNFANKQTSTKRTYVKEYEVSTGDESNIRKMIGSYK